MAEPSNPYVVVGPSPSASLLSNEPRRRKGTMQNPTRLPKRPVFSVCYMRLSEPLSIWVIFPFLNEMVHATGIVDNPEEVGYYSGLVESSYAFAQFLTIYFWGALSDRIGRKPVLCIGLAGLITCTIGFGFAKTFAVMLFFRFIGAALNGNAAVGKCVLGEVTDETNQARAFSFLSPAWAIGSIIAPIIGGFFSRPAERFPNVFGSWTLFRTFPYLLPCVMGGLCTSTGLLVGLFVLKETLPVQIRKKALSAHRPLHDHHGHHHSDEHGHSPAPRNYGAVHVEPAHEETPVSGGITLIEMLGISDIRRVLISYTLLGLITVCIDSIFVLWMYTPVKGGGVGLNPSQIGTMMSSVGCMSTIIGLFIFPPAQRRLGTIPIYRFCMSLYVVIVILFPFVHYLAKQHYTIAYFGVAVIGLLKSTAGTVFACVMILVNTIAPSRTSLGKINGAAQTSASMMRTIGPTMASTLFALSNHKGLAGGYGVYLVLGALALTAAASTWFVEEGSIEERNEEDEA